MYGERNKEKKLICDLYDFCGFFFFRFNYMFSFVLSINSFDTPKKKYQIHNSCMFIRSMYSIYATKMCTVEWSAI